MHILQEIVEQKKLEVKDLYEMYSLEELKKSVEKSPKDFYASIKAKKAKGEHFFITEFKRKSPSEGMINADVPANEQINKYIDLGSDAVSVLTDHKYFGGTYNDLEFIAEYTKETPLCILQKDFIIDPIQIYLARKYGANLILLITRILTRDALKQFKDIAESLGMGVLLEIHNEEEYEKIKGLDFPVIGINNRDLDTFTTRLNHFNSVVRSIEEDAVFVAESGINFGSDIKVLSNHSDAYLIGTALMKGHFTTELIDYTRKPVFKACGIRSEEDLKANSDLIGINFSPISKRKVNGDEEWLKNLPKNAVAVFKNNSEEEIKSITERFGFKYIQVYHGDVSEDFIKSLKCKVILAHAVQSNEDFTAIEAIAKHTDFIILDGPFPGSGKGIEIDIPQDFHYPFLMAGGINKDNIDKALSHPTCIGVDIASGIEMDGQVSLDTIDAIHQTVKNIEHSK